MKINIEVLKEDIKHCEDKIIELETNNECWECIDSHKRLLEYMLFCKDRIESPVINTIPSNCNTCRGWDNYTNRCMYYVCLNNNKL